jgi:cysteinyl-tRNA synthetase
MQNGKFRIYNTRTGRVEEFNPIHPNRINIFVCGPTVYDRSHLGHARTYIVFDSFVKYLRFKGYQVFYIMNVTDIDDKIIARASELGEDPLELADHYLGVFLEDMDSLRIDSVSLYPKATDHIPEIIEQIQILLDKGAAYESKGSIYFKVDSYPDIGQLSRQKPDKLKPGARVQVREEKYSPEDFVLWRAKGENEPYWPSPWGEGRPGWHIEDTAIAVTYFGRRYDLHGGALDLIFPHHEAEIAIAESCYGERPYVNVWMHTGFLTVDGEKMSKSLGNFITIGDALKSHRPEVIRFLTLCSHYRSPLDYSEGKIQEAENGYAHLERSFSRAFEGKATDEREGEQLRKLEEIKLKFFESLDNDFNTREAITKLFELANFINNQNNFNEKFLKNLKLFINSTYKILGIFDIEGERAGRGIVDGLMEIILESRDELRKRKIYDLSDRIRESLKRKGIEIEDEGEKSRWRFLDRR